MEKSERCDAIYQEIILIELNEIKRHRIVLRRFGRESDWVICNSSNNKCKTKTKNRKMRKTSENFQYKLLCIYTIWII